MGFLFSVSLFLLISSVMMISAFLPPCSRRSSSSIAAGKLMRESSQLPLSKVSSTISTYPSRLSRSSTSSTTARFATELHATGGSLHGQNSCFLPLQQLDQDYYAPRIVQIAGGYPGLTKEEYMAVQSEEAPDPGQWNYDFSDPDGPQMGTVAIQGSATVHGCADPVVIIAEHPTLGVELPNAITDPVDLIVLVDRGNKNFKERTFIVLSIPETDELQIRAFGSKSELPPDSEILGRVELVQIPWLPAMTPTRTGFLEADEYF